METTPRLGLWTLIPGQAQKETSVNEAFHLLDAIVAGTVEGPARASPPTTPTPGTSYIIANQASGEWSGHDGAIAAFTPGGWRYVAPTDGITILEKADRCHPPISQRNLGAGPWSAPSAHCECYGRVRLVDVESRATIAALLDALRAHGLIET
jgi:hypothetical protein